jgi:hypothetical protein
VVKTPKRKRDRMTRKQFEAIASVLKEHLDSTETTPSGVYQWGRMCHAFADMCAENNPRFVRAKFLNACGWVEAFGSEYK